MRRAVAALMAAVACSVAADEGMSWYVEDEGRLYRCSNRAGADVECHEVRTCAEGQAGCEQPADDAAVGLAPAEPSGAEASGGDQTTAGTGTPRN